MEQKNICFFADKDELVGRDGRSYTLEENELGEFYCSSPQAFHTLPLVYSAWTAVAVLNSVMDFVKYKVTKINSKKHEQAALEVMEIEMSQNPLHNTVNDMALEHRKIVISGHHGAHEDLMGTFKLATDRRVNEVGKAPQHLKSRPNYFPLSVQQTLNQPDPPANKVPSLRDEKSRRCR